MPGYNQSPQVDGYEGWVFPYFLARQFGPRIIPRVFAFAADEEARQNSTTVLDALNFTIGEISKDKGLPELWKAFARAAFNRVLRPHGIPASFRTWLGMKAVPQGVHARRPKLGVTRQRFKLKPYAREYQDLHFDMTNARRVVFRRRSRRTNARRLPPRR